MDILIISGDPIIPGIRESVNLNTLQIELGKSDITVGDLLNYLKRKDSVLQQLSKNRGLNLYYIRDGRPIFLKKEGRLRMYSGYETLYLSQELNYGAIEDRSPIRRTEEAPVETPAEMSEEAFSRFRWGFTTATGFLIFLWIVFLMWNTIMGSLLFIIIFCYIPAILYVSLVDNSIRYYRIYKIKHLYIADIFGIFVPVLIILEVILNFPLVLCYGTSYIIVCYLIITEKNKKLSERTRFILGIGGILTLIIGIPISKVPTIGGILVFLPYLSYFLSKKIFKISVSKRYDLFIDVFKDWFYKLRIAILILIIYIIFFILIN